MDSSFSCGKRCNLVFSLICSGCERRFWGGLALPELNRSRCLAFWGALLALLAFTLAAADPALAAVHRHHSVPAFGAQRPAAQEPCPPSAVRGLTARLGGRITPMPMGATDPDKDAALIVDGSNGKTLYARNETALRHPASLTR